MKYCVRKVPSRDEVGNEAPLPFTVSQSTRNGARTEAIFHSISTLSLLLLHNHIVVRHNMCTLRNLCICFVRQAASRHVSTIKIGTICIYFNQMQSPAVFGCFALLDVCARADKTLILL